MTFEDAFCRMLERDHALAALFPRSPAYRYFSHRGYRYCWTTERMSGGVYQSFVYQPVGKGSRSGEAKTLKLTRVVSHKTRRAAKARAERLYEKAVAS
jgi:hypothetical protein